MNVVPAGDERVVIDWLLVIGAWKGEWTNQQCACGQRRTCCRGLDLEMVINQVELASTCGERFGNQRTDVIRHGVLDQDDAC